MNFDLSNVIVELEYISPDIAGIYLAKNFENNRTPSLVWIKELAREMRMGLFTISCDCIGFDTNDRIINGQHRLQAVIESNTTQPFIVLRNLPPDVAQLIDVGKKRTMAQRITIGGTRMSEKQCSTIRNALVDYSENEIGTVAFAHKRFDKLIEKYFLKHSEYLTNPQIIKFEGRGSSFWTAAALRIYAEMCYKISKGFEFRHGQTPLDRSIFWLELVRDALSTNYVTDPITDNSAIIIRNMKEKCSGDSRGSKWSSKADLRLTLSSAWHFMMGNTMKTIRPHGEDPFMKFTDLPSTNTIDS